MSGSDVAQRILTRLGLARVAIADQLQLVLQRVRLPQLEALDTMLAALPPPVLHYLEGAFDRTLDVRHDLERLVTDVLRVRHLLMHHSLEPRLLEDTMALVWAVGVDHPSRQQLTRSFQTLLTNGESHRVLAAFVALALQLSIKTRVELYALFVDDLAALQHWCQWLASPTQASTEQALTFFVKTATDRCLALWLKLLRPLQDPADLRLRVVRRVVDLDSATLKQLARFLDVTGTSVQRILDFSDAAIFFLPRLLNELPMATLMTVLHRLQSDSLIHAVVRALDEVRDSNSNGSNNTVIRLIDALALVDSARALELFLPAMLDYSRRDELLRLFLNFSPQQQLRFLDLMVATKDAAPIDPTEPRDDRFILFQLFLCAHFHSYDLVIHRLSSLSPSVVGAMVLTLASYSEDDLILVGEIIEAIAGPQTLCTVLKLFDWFPHDARVLLVAEWVHDMPGDDAMVVYEALERLHTEPTSPKKLVKVLEMLSGLRRLDKRRLCQRVLHPASPTENDEVTSQHKALNDHILSYLCECELSQREVIKLFATIDRSQFSDLLFLLRTQQRLPEQVALTTLLLGLSAASNTRVLTLLRSMEVDTLDAFFQLLLIMPTTEYKMLAKVLVSADISAFQLAQVVQVTMSLMNQAASREMIAFVAMLPPMQRQNFLSLIDDKPQNGVLTRLVATGGHLPSETLYALLDLFVKLAWDARSALLEQIRAFEDVDVVRVYLETLQSIAPFGLSDNAPMPALLPRVIHTITLLQLSTRVSLIKLLCHVSALERCRILRRLDAKPKDGLALFCRRASDVSLSESVRVLFWRVFARLDPAFDDGMLHVLLQRECWVFFGYLGEILTENEVSATDASIVNGFAASLLLLHHADDFLLLSDVMEEALQSNCIQLQELVVVLAHFRDRDRLVLFLRYVIRLTRRSPSTLFFRVLAKCQETAFLFDMCNILDLDDALFALRRLERMWMRDPERTNDALHAMAGKGAVQAKDGFCNFVLGYKECGPSNRKDGASLPERYLFSRQHQEDPGDQHGASPSSSLWELSSDDVDIAPYAIGESHSQRLNLDRHRRRQKGRQNEKRHRYSDWRNWSQSQWDQVLDGAEASTAARNKDTQTDFAAAEPSFSSASVVTEAPTPQSDHGLGAISGTIKTPWIPSSQDLDGVLQPRNTRSAETLSESSDFLLPPLRRTPSHESLGGQRVSLQQRSQRLEPDGQLPSSTLNRSESAPSALHSIASPLSMSTQNRSKAHRGLRAALNEPIEEFHVPRDRGASIFQKQCEYEVEHGPSRLRVAKSKAAQARVFAARVQHALGQRAHLTSPLKPSLQRGDPHTIERATMAVATAEATRASPVLRWSNHDRE
ncbi:hypothetical protein PINS_up015011 [Pythium insidiosum]|nr:hypothetical protein PINS_up015011 [Pythium insidiosum]